MPHVMTDDTADDPSHFYYREEFRPDWPAALAAVACGIRKGSDPNLSAETLEPIAPGVRDTDGGSYWPPFGQQLSNNSATGPSGCAGYENFWVSHNKETRVVFCCRYDIVP